MTLLTDTFLHFSGVSVRYTPKIILLMYEPIEKEAVIQTASSPLEASY
ncbi:hypothetical protein [Mesobacillus selenatarsenatis]|uniref:Uncharacterized protein n=1 Tax=Mesobacillus selenatarsenatis (strain DSM 18680 / JCM 14380 / FERM P-15431 / SF-1) TaxID=1321606 RepID=A0A0A8X8S1_MESS1|nr:hypothetical protein [Mesobacillus selenatarsenatis]GAM16345.1 hypothetical protein SAMD00020551_4534 [Mesobacillus selenatarsenatis SF-1]